MCVCVAAADWSPMTSASVHRGDPRRHGEEVARAPSLRCCPRPTLLCSALLCCAPRGHATASRRRPSRQQGAIDGRGGLGSDRLRRISRRSARLDGWMDGWMDETVRTASAMDGRRNNKEHGAGHAW